MTTFKQIEVLVALAEAGSISAAARRLDIAQSAASKHLSDLEAQFPSALVDRSSRRAKLTVDGAEVLMQSRRVLTRRDALLDALSSQALPVERLRLGVTEVTALTWLTVLLRAFGDEFPNVEIEPRVEISTSLRHRLRAGELDAAVVPDLGPAPGLRRQRIGSIENHWYCSPSIHPKRRAALRFEDLRGFTLLSQGALARSGMPLDRWLADNGIAPRSILSSSSLPALLDMLASGMGAGYLPEPLVRDRIRSGSVTALRVRPKLPAVEYVLLMRDSASTRMQSRMLELVRRVCDFTR